MAAVATRIHGLPNKQNNSPTPSSQASSVPESKAKRVANAILEYTKNDLKGLSKGFNYGFSWAAIGFPESPHASVFSGISCFMADFKNSICVTEITPQALEVGEKIQAFFKEPSTTTARALFKVFTKWINTTYDGFSVIGRFVAPIGQNIKAFFPLHCAATFGGSFNGMVQTFQDIAAMKVSNMHKTAWHVINIFRDFSFTALGASGLYPIIAPMVLSPASVVALPMYTGLVCVSSGWFWSTVGHFFNELVVKPEEEKAAAVTPPLRKPPVKLNTKKA